MKATEAQQIEFFDKLRKLQDQYAVNLHIESGQAVWQWADMPEPMPTVAPKPTRMEWRIIDGRRVMVEV